MNLTVRGLDARYGSTRVLHDVSCEVPDGTMVAMIGANGAGKTTLLKCIAGLHRPAKGEITLGGSPVTGLAAHHVARRRVCLVPAGRQLFGDLTVAENLRVGLGSRGESGRLERVYALFPVLREFADRQSGLLSGGQQQMLAIARALVREPEVLLLDEPSLGIAPLLVTEILGVLRQLARDGVTILLAEQNAAAALAIADHGVVMENGTITRTDTAAALLADEDVSRHYLGTSADPVSVGHARALPAGLREPL
ncbi:ABC transporter ATP-binding protein [Amycolatopsis sp. FDAARGOS 1241]|uniref:ABC transporter ATP-binding protein n=1 Tax=Amycolatopsis sp. FDAARGOS 1241 TaxID=2778070 RepID=UPI00194E8D67|nr:ABC transporter ATP-binding protein [Amycolatopsis sp. FDAARGOS 1241]QRP49479.1 ABC transporter ATP-binding protein [Amycolatopsis sp. FDAARGOS 1241]